MIASKLNVAFELCVQSVSFFFLAALVGCGGKSDHRRDEGTSAGGGAEQPAGGATNTGATAGSETRAAGAGGVGGAGGSAIVQAPTPCQGGCQDTGPRPVPLARPTCPVDEPTLGDPCSVPDLLCGYGDAPTPRCRGYYHCADGSWEQDPSLNRYPCVMNANCPAQAENLSACTLEAAGVPCAYSDLLCFCSTGKNEQPGAPGNWDCYGPPMNPDCPATLPNIGEGCVEQGLECHYAVDGCTAPPHSSVFCRGGAWEDGEKITCQVQ